MGDQIILIAQECSHQADLWVAVEQVESGIHAARIQNEIVIGNHQHIAPGLGGQSIHVSGEVIRNPLGDVQVVAACVVYLRFFGVSAVP